MGDKWVYQVKEGVPTFKLICYKARVFAKGFMKRVGIEFTKIFSLVIKHSSSILLLFLVVHNNMKVEIFSLVFAWLP